ncbi:DUF4123 domain-containing protein [Celeribacter naphthalenivorans]|uniref:DUF4123 domain-containing protein n=1 Tax=Celeribacter naphthalenivorans TaxID=1614694 RepID=UPI001CFB0002|nr:DUF4123 domain-containing protein [Celeribacter naphthalenivorans]
MALLQTVEPWQIAQALLHPAQSEAVTHRILAEVPPLLTGLHAPEERQPIEDVLDALFSPPADPDQSWHVYALLDAARSQGLPARLDSSALAHSCLYDLNTAPQLADGAPWLVELTREAAFTGSCFAHDPDRDDPRKMLGAGIFLASALPLDAMRRHLKHYTKLSDEAGIAQYFRLQEPGMLDALLCASDPAAVTKFFQAGTQLVYPRPALEPGLWEFVALTAGRSEAEGEAIPRLDRPARTALALFVNDSRARNLAAEAISAPEARPFAHYVFARMMQAGFDHAPRLLDTHRLLCALPEEARTAFWADAESGVFSPRPLLLRYANRYGCLELLDGENV